MNDDRQQPPVPVPLDELPLSRQGQERQRRRSRSRVKKLFSRIQRRLNYRAISGFSIVAFVIIFLSIVVLIVDAGAKLNVSWQSMNRILQSVESRQGTDLTLADFNRVRVGVKDLSAQITTTQSRLRLMSPAIALSYDLRTMIDLLDISNLLVSATETMMDGLEPAINFLVRGEDNEAITSQISSGERLSELLEIGQGRFFEASNLLAEAKTRLNEMSLATVSPGLLLNYDQIDSFHQQLATINTILLTSPDILGQVLGVEDEVTYLVLAQNNDEIRPSGGYIGTYGWFNMRNGRVTDYNYSATTTTSPRPPDESFLNTFEMPDWWLNYQNPIYAAWDGSWYADFPSTADLALRYYNQGQNPNSPVDGVIAIDITGFELILDVLGEVIVSDYNRTIYADNFRDVVYDIRTYGDLEHKRFIASVYRAIFNEWQSVSQEKSSALFTALIEALTQRHIMIYVPDAETQSVLDLLGWSGSQISPNGHDYLLVADTNLGNKSNNSVIRSLTYDVDVRPDQSRLSRLRLRYDYFDSVASNDPAIDAEYHGAIDYRTLTQIYLPSDINLIEHDNLRSPAVLDMNPFSLLVSRIDVNYDTSERVQLTYETPAQEDRIGNYYRYRLLIQKQPGARVQDVNLQIQLPVDAQIISTLPDADASYNLENPILDFRLQLVSDQWIEVIYKQ